MLLANHADKKIYIGGIPTIISRGQFHTSVIKLADRWVWSRNKVIRYLTMLERDNMITTSGTPNGTTISIVNYGKFQDMRTTNETTNDTTDETTGETTTDTTGGTTDGTQTTIKQLNNVNNVNKENNNIPRERKHKYGEYEHVLLTDTERDKLMNEYGELETTEAIKFLDEYIEMKGYKAKSHYLAIRKWVFDAIKRNEQKKPQSRNLFDELRDA